MDEKQNRKMSREKMKYLFSGIERSIFVYHSYEIYFIFFLDRFWFCFCSFLVYYVPNLFFLSLVPCDILLKPIVIAFKFHVVLSPGKLEKFIVYIF